MKQFLLIAAIALSITSCSKKDYSAPPAPNQPTIPADDARPVLLKDVVSVTLPNPYFRFTYDSLRYVKQINFASGFSIYDVVYINKRVQQMTNTKNGNTLFYRYHNGQVAAIDEFSGISGNKIFSYRFSYNNNQLMQVIWFDHRDNIDGHIYKKAVLSYHADGNLASIDNYGLAGDAVVWLTTERYSNYDNKTNVDDFYLLEDFLIRSFFCRK